MIDLHCCSAVITLLHLNACTVTAILPLSDSTILNLHSQTASGNIIALHRLLVGDEVSGESQVSNFHGVKIRKLNE